MARTPAPAGDATAGGSSRRGRSPSTCGWGQVPLRKGPGATFGHEPMSERIGTGDVAVGGSPCVKQQEPLLQPAGATSPGGRRRCCCGHRKLFLVEKLKERSQCVKSQNAALVLIKHSNPRGENRSPQHGLWGHPHPTRPRTATPARKLRKFWRLHNTGALPTSISTVARQFSARLWVHTSLGLLPEGSGTAWSPPTWSVRLLAAPRNMGPAVFLGSPPTRNGKCWDDVVWWNTFIFIPDGADAVSSFVVRSSVPWNMAV